MRPKPKFHARDVPTLATSVQREIERMILEGEVTAGERLSESALALSMGVSRGPVREAMRGLAQQGLIDVFANRGVVVRSVDLAEALQLYDLRCGIFGVACEALAASAEASLLDELRQLQSSLAGAISSGDRDAYYADNIAFHRCILDHCGNRPAREAYERVVASMHLFRRRGLAEMGNMRNSFAEHQAIVDAVAAGNIEAAGTAGRQHVRSGKLRFQASLSEQDGGEVGGRKSTAEDSASTTPARLRA